MKYYYKNILHWQLLEGRFRYWKY